MAGTVVIGAGIAGASTAFWLAERGLRPVLIDRGRPASGPTGKSSAIVHAFYLSPELSRLAGRGTDILRRMREFTGRDAGYRSVGMLWAVGQEAAAGWTKAVDRIHADGYQIETLSVDALSRLAPQFTIEGIALAVWEPTSGYADPTAATQALVDGARDRGAQIRVNCAARRIEVRGGRVSGVELSNGERIAADVVVAAVGPWTKPLIGELGIDLPLRVERHPMAVVDAPSCARKILPFAWCDNTMLHYARPEGDDLILVGTWSGGGTAERQVTDGLPETPADPDQYAEEVGLDESIKIIEFMAPRVPQISALGVRRGYAGVYDMSPDDNPVIGPIPGLQGLYVVAGSSGHGFKMGPAVGEEVARLIDTGASDLLRPFGVERFAEASAVG